MPAIDPVGTSTSHRSSPTDKKSTINMSSSSLKASVTPNTTLDVNALLNRTSVALARSQRLIDSWLPAAKNTGSIDHTAQGHASSNTNSAEAGTDDKAAMQDLLSQVGRSEKAGLGYVDPALTLGKNGLPAPGAKGGESELAKLRRQMLGKKAAAQGAKARSAVDRSGLPGVGASGSKGGVPATNGQSASSFQGQKRRGREEAGDSDEDEGGRASAFRSKKMKRVKSISNTTGSATDNTTTTTNGGMQEEESLAPVSDKQEEHKQDDGHNRKQDDAANDEDVAVEDDVDVEVSKATKVKKPTSYLDEILLQRDKKKKKKKNKKKQNGTLPENSNTT